MKKILFITCVLLSGSFVAQAQEDSDVVGTTTTTTKTKVIVKKETAPVVITADEMNSEGDASTNTDMKKILAERENRARAIRAAKKAENKAYAEKAKTGVTTSKAKVVTKEMLEAEKIEKQKKATKKDN